jgi:hypothetical protein
MTVPGRWALMVFVLAACPAPRSPGDVRGGTDAIAATVEIGRAGGVLTGVAGNGALVFAALSTLAPGSGVETGTAADSHASGAGAGMSGAGTSGAAPSGSTTTVEALRPSAGRSPVWRAELAGYGGPLAVAATQLVAAVGGRDSVAGIALRGEPGAVVVALDAATGAPAWKLAVDSTEWAVIAAIAAGPAGPGSLAGGDGVVIGGSFSGTLRIADKVLSSAGHSDGFVARLTATGGLAWLIGVGGPGADAVHGVACAADRIAIAGTFSVGADLLGETLTPVEERSPRGDGFVAELDPTGARRWVQSFGGKADDAVAGVAIDAAGRIAVAATAQDVVHVGAVELTAAGSADGLVAWWGPGGSAINAVLVGGPDFDGLRAIAAAGNRVVIAGFYAGSIRLGDQALTAAGGDDAFVAAIEPTGVAQVWPVRGDGREEVTALAAIPGGFVAGVSHTAGAQVDAAVLPSPPDPMSGAAIVVRAAH